MQLKTSKFFFEKYIFLICIVLLIFFWFFSNKIPFLNYHIGLGTEFDYAWANSINYGNSIIFKNHFLDFYNSLILPNLEIGKNINISPYNIFNPFYFLSHIGFGQFSIFFSTLITAILCLYSLQRILIIFKIDNFTSIIISYLVITFWSLKFTQDHFQMLSSYHFLIIYLHFFIESKYTNKTNYIYFIFCFLLAPQVAHIGFVVWILIPSIIGIAFIKKIKNIIFFALLSLAWLPWLLTLSNRNLNVISNINQNYSKLKIFDFQNFFLENKFQGFLANDNFWLSFVYPMKVVGMTYIPIGLFLFSILIFFFLKTYRHKINSFLIIITLITIFNILFINTNIFTDIMGRSMNRFLFNFISLLILLIVSFLPSLVVNVLVFFNIAEISSPIVNL